MATYVLSGSRAGWRSVVLTDSGANKSYMIVGVGVETEKASSGSTSLTGYQLTTAIGTLTATPSIDVIVSGVNATTAVGTLGIGTAPSITGQQINTAIGSPTLGITRFSGQQINTAIGILSVSTSLPAINGVQINAGIGQLMTVVKIGTQVQLTSFQLTASIGTLGTGRSISIIGQQANKGVQANVSIGSLQALGYVGQLFFDNLSVDELTKIEEDTMVSLRWSDTEGQDWHDPIHRSLGLTGDYLMSLQWQRLGMARRGRVFEIMWSAPVPTCLLGATVRYDAGRT